jgi:hypothetical protein
MHYRGWWLYRAALFRFILVGKERNQWDLKSSFPANGETARPMPQAM